MTKAQEKIKERFKYLDSRAAQSANALVALTNFSKKERNEKTLNQISRECHKEMAQIQKSCTHEMYYAGHSHNDDCYECVICGFIDWR